MMMMVMRDRSPSAWIIADAIKGQYRHNNWIEPPTNHDVNGSTMLQALVQIDCVCDGEPAFHCNDGERENGEMPCKDGQAASGLATDTLISARFEKN
jgi:hypothetical protein